MKKIFVSFGILALGLGALGLSGKPAVKAGADDISDLKALLTGYNVGGYTKKTQMYLQPDAVTELAAYFHNGQNTLKRATYYNAAETALLMGNYDGTFGGEGGINGGFRNIDANNCERFHYTGVSPTSSNLFDADKTQRDYTAEGQTVGGYYQTLSSLADAVVADQWVKNGGAYIHNINDLQVTNGEYNDPVLKKFQYFAAPMLKQNAYFSWHTIRVVEGASFLSIRLYTTAEDGDGKSTLIGDAEALVSEARIYKGIDLNPEVTWNLKGTFNSWGNNDSLTYSADLYNPEQYRITKTLSAGDEFKLYSPKLDSWMGRNKVENGGWFNGTGDGNIIVKYDGTYTIYLKPSSDSMYISVDSDMEYTLTWSETWVKDSSPKIFAWVVPAKGEGSWVLTTYDNDRTAVLTAPATTKMFVLVRADKSKTTGAFSGDGYWNKTEDIILNDGKLSYPTSWTNL